MLDLEPFLGAILSICWGVPPPKMSDNGHTIFRRAQCFILGWFHLGPPTLNLVPFWGAAFDELVAKATCYILAEIHF